MKKKKIDAIEMKRKAQEKIYEEIKNLTAEEQVEYFNRAGKEFWAEIDGMRTQAEKPKRKGGESRKRRGASLKRK